MSKTTMYVHNPCSKYTSHIFGRINSLKCDLTPNTLSLIVIKHLNMIVIPYGGKIIEFLIYSWR